MLLSRILKIVKIDGFSHSRRLLFACVTLATFCAMPLMAQQDAARHNPLVDVLLGKGILTADEAKAGAIKDELAAIPGTLRTRVLY